MQTSHRPTPGHWQATTHSISKTPARQNIGNSPILPAVTHPHGFAPADLRFDLVEKFHARTIGREIALDLGIPLAAISLSKPVQEGYLLLIGKRLNSVLDLPKVHVRIVPLGALKERITRLRPGAGHPKPEMGQPVNLDWRTGAESRMPPSPASSLRYSSECHYIVEITVNKAVSAADANRRFSELLRTVKQGRSVVVTSHGKPVATISPVVKDNRAAEGARAALFARLRRERVVNAGRWTRDELYDDAP